MNNWIFDISYKKIIFYVNDNIHYNNNDDI